MEILLTIAITFISSKDNDEERVMHSKSDLEFVICNNAVEVTKELLQLIFSRYQIRLEKLMRGSDFIFDLVHLMHCKWHKINLKGSYRDSPDSIKNNKATINPVNKNDNKCFQYTVKVALNYEKK